MLRAGDARRTRWASRYPWTCWAKLVVVVRRRGRRQTRRRSDLQQGVGICTGGKDEGAVGRRGRRVCVSAFGHRLCFARASVALSLRDPVLDQDSMLSCSVAALLGPAGTMYNCVQHDCSTTATSESASTCSPMRENYVQDRNHCQASLALRRG